MIKVAALTSGRDIPSTRYRIRQYIEPLQGWGIKVLESCPWIDKWKPIPGKPARLSNRRILPIYAIWQGIKLATRVPGVISSYRYDITWLSRQLLPGYLTFEPILKRPLVFDVDDAIWLTTPFGTSAVACTAKRADVVIAGNTYLANWFDKWSKDVRIIPTAVDTERYHPTLSSHDASDQFVIGWIGSSANLPYLEDIEDVLNKFLISIPNASILVVSDRTPHFKYIAFEKMRYIPWSEKAEAETIQKMDVGIMPLPDNEWTRGKCSFKMLQYMSCGIPVVVSPVGMNHEVLKMGNIGFQAKYPIDWNDALSYLYHNRDKASMMGSNGRTIVRKCFAKEKVVQNIAKIFLSFR